MEAACTWMQKEENEGAWKVWIPPEQHSCDVGNYAVNETSCAPCPPGSGSVGGAATACRQCTAGTSARPPLRGLCTDAPFLAGPRDGGGLGPLRLVQRRTPCGAGLFQPDSGQYGCLSCDSLGDFYQDLQGQTSCQFCPQNTQRHIGVLDGANRTACQCKEGAISATSVSARVGFNGPSHRRVPQRETRGRRGSLLSSSIVSVRCQR